MQTIHAADLFNKKKVENIYTLPGKTTMYRNRKWGGRQTHKFSLRKNKTEVKLKQRISGEKKIRAQKYEIFDT